MAAKTASVQAPQLVANLPVAIERGHPSGCFDPKLPLTLHLRDMKTGTERPLYFDVAGEVTVGELRKATLRPLGCKLRQHPVILLGTAPEFIFLHFLQYIISAWITLIEPIMLYHSLTLILTVLLQICLWGTHARPYDGHHSNRVVSHRQFYCLLAYHLYCFLTFNSLTCARLLEIHKK